MDDLPLSPHFLLSEFTRSQIALRLGIDNTPNAAQIANMGRLCTDFGEPARTLLGVALHIDSGFRSPIINSAVGGAIDSSHLDGRAMDVIPIGMDLREAFDKLRASNLPFDELLIECGAWLHIGMAEAGAIPRARYEIASGGPGHWVYTPA